MVRFVFLTFSFFAYFVSVCTQDLPQRSERSHDKLSVHAQAYGEVKHRFEDYLHKKSFLHVTLAYAKQKLEQIQKRHGRVKVDLHKLCHVPMLQPHLLTSSPEYHREQNYIQKYIDRRQVYIHTFSGTVSDSGSGNEDSSSITDASWSGQQIDVGDDDYWSSQQVDETPETVSLNSARSDEVSVSRYEDEDEDAEWVIEEESSSSCDDDEDEAYFQRVQESREIEGRQELYKKLQKERVRGARNKLAQHGYNFTRFESLKHALAVAAEKRSGFLNGLYSCFFADDYSRLHSLVEQEEERQRILLELIGADEKVQEMEDLQRVKVRAKKSLEQAFERKSKARQDAKAITWNSLWAAMYGRSEEQKIRE